MTNYCTLFNLDYEGGLLGSNEPFVYESIQDAIWQYTQLCAEKRCEAGDIGSNGELTKDCQERCLPESIEAVVLRELEKNRALDPERYDTPQSYTDTLCNEGYHGALCGACEYSRPDGSKWGLQ